MSSLRSLRAIAGAAIVFAATLPAATAQDTQDAEEDRVVATVNGDDIMLSEVLAMLDQLPPNMVQQIPPPMLVPLVADQLVNGRLMAAEGYAVGLEDSEDVQARLEQAERQFVQQAWLDQTVEERITDERLQTIYDELVMAQPPQDEVQARHILVETEEEALEVIAAIEEGGDFAELAQERSTGPSGPRGGDLGYFSQGDMVPAFGEAAFALEVGAHSTEPVETQFGWHVIKVEDRRTVEPPSLEEVRPQIEDELRNRLSQEIVAELRDAAEITLFDEEGQPLP